MALGHQTNLEEIKQVINVHQPSVSCGKINLNEICSLDLIRIHTKTDDVPYVTDTQLELYRKAAFEAAQQYTGMLLTEHQQIIETVRLLHGNNVRKIKRHVTQYPVADGIIYLFDATNGISSRTIEIDPGSRKVSIPLLHYTLDLSPCCGGCGQEINSGPSVKLMYRAGFSSLSDIPAGIIVGALKYIAWLVSNPGDEIMTVRNRLSNNETGIVGTNNTAWASGALELWRQYDAEAI